MDIEGFEGTIKEGDWQNTVRSGCALTSFSKAKRGRVTYDAKTIQLSLKECLNSAPGQLEWQWDYIKRTGR